MLEAGSISALGFQSEGHAVGYIRRMANNSPDRSSTFHIMPWSTRWFVFFGTPQAGPKSGSKLARPRRQTVSEEVQEAELRAGWDPNP